MIITIQRLLSHDNEFFYNCMMDQAAHNILQQKMKHSDHTCWDFFQICHPGEAKSLVCPTPVINLPENRISRRKRQTAELPGEKHSANYCFN